jgi:hypothetical protein
VADAKLSNPKFDDDLKSTQRGAGMNVGPIMTVEVHYTGSHQPSSYDCWRRSCIVVRVGRDHRNVQEEVLAYKRY